MNENPSRPRTSGSRMVLALGLAAVVGGLWLFLDAQGMGVPQFRRFWPVLLLIAAAASLADFLFLGRGAGSLGWTVAWTGLGVMCFSLSLGRSDWGRILDWLPSLPTIFGLSLLTTWLADRSRENYPLAGGILVVLGLVGFIARFDVLKRILPSAQVLWAILLVAAGAYLVWRAVQGSRNSS